MARLALEGVASGPIQSASLVVGSGEIASVFSTLRSERSALLRVAAGIDAPSSGTISVDGRVVLAQSSWEPVGGSSVLQQLILPQLAGKGSIAQARSRALAALAEWGVEDWSVREVHELGDDKLVLLSLIRAFVSAPEILLVDDPLSGIGDGPAREILSMLHGAREKGAAILLITSTSVGAMKGADGLYMINQGVLRGVRQEPGALIQFPQQRTG